MVCKSNFLYLKKKYCSTTLSFKKNIGFGYNVTKKAELQWRMDHAGEANTPQWGIGTHGVARPPAGPSIIPHTAVPLPPPSSSSLTCQV